ncbi:MAG: cell division protein FtsQ/DivIB [Nitrospiria bacterium]
MQRKRDRRRQRKKQKKGLSGSGMKGMFRIVATAVVFGTLLFAVALGLERIAVSPVFRVEKILWVGLQHLQEKEMKTRFQSVVGRNIFQVDIQEIHRRLISDKWIKEAVVKKDFPNRLVIRVVERKPASVEYRLKDFEERVVDRSVAPVVLDTEGMVLQKGGALPTGLAPLIHVNREAYDRALDLWDLVGDRSDIYIDLSNPKDLQVYITTRDGERRLGVIHFGEEITEDSWDRYVSIETDLRERGVSPWEVDLRFDGQAVMRSGRERDDPASEKPSAAMYF